MLLMILSEMVETRSSMLPLICVGSLTRVVKDCC